MLFLIFLLEEIDLISGFHISQFLHAYHIVVLCKTRYHPALYNLTVGTVLFQTAEILFNRSGSCEHRAGGINSDIVADLLQLIKTEHGRFPAFHLVPEFIYPLNRTDLLHVFYIGKAVGINDVCAGVTIRLFNGLSINVISVVPVLLVWITLVFKYFEFMTFENVISHRGNFIKTLIMNNQIGVVSVCQFWIGFPTFARVN